MKNLPACTFISLLILLQACTYNVESFNYKPYHCDPEPPLDSLYLTQHLIGKWDWKYTICEKSGESDNQYLGLSLEFFEDGTVNKLEDNIFVSTSIWRIVKINGSLELGTSPGIIQTRGIIYLCDNYVYFDELGRDICNNYYKRN